jgi:hypothetical protein
MLTYTTTLLLLHWYQAQRREGLTRESDIRRTEQRSAREVTALRSQCSQLEAAARDAATAAAAALSSARAEAAAAAAQAAAAGREVQALQQECAQCSAAADEHARARTAAEVCVCLYVCSVHMIAAEVLLLWCELSGNSNDSTADAHSVLR